MTTHYGAIGAAWACLIAGIINIPVYYFAMFRTLRLRLSVFLAVVWRPIISSIMMYFVVQAVATGLGIGLGSIGALPYLLGIISLGAAVYTALIAVLWLASGRPNSAEQVALREALNQLKKITNKV